jgi:hypothetical protein
MNAEEKAGQVPATHSARCKVCKHKDHLEIDSQMIEWDSIASIAREYGLTKASLHRHARATGVYAKRNVGNLRGVALRIAAKIGSLAKLPTYSEILQAVTIAAKIDPDTGRWVDHVEQDNAPPIAVAPHEMHVHFVDAPHRPDDPKCACGGCKWKREHPEIKEHGKALGEANSERLPKEADTKE